MDEQEAIDEEIESLKLQIYYYEELRLEMERNLDSEMGKRDEVESDLQEKALNL